MRMWMVDPSIMCNQHLLGEHVELHMIVGHLKRNRQIGGYVRNNCIEPLSILTRHKAISDEMKKRGFKHKRKTLSVNFQHLPKDDILAKVNAKSSLADLVSRCKKCNERWCS